MISTTGRHIPIQDEEFGYFESPDGDSKTIIIKKFSYDLLGFIYKTSDEILDKNNARIYSSFFHTVLKELVQNAVKATYKRIYYQLNKYDLNTDNSEIKEKFKESYPQFISSFIEVESYYDHLAEVEISRYNKDYILLSVKNECEMISNEKNAVNFMIERGKQKSHVADLLHDELNSTQKEGGGLGISMIIVLLKNLDLPAENFSYESKNGFTEFKVVVPIKI